MYTSHGHQIDGTPVEGKRPNVARCGGPALCSLCAIQSAHAAKMHKFLNPTKGPIMQFDTYTRKPFTVEAVEITDENMEEVAKFIGTIEIREEDQVRYIEVDRRLIPNLYRVYTGFFLTKLGDKTRCYSPRAFKKQFELVEDNGLELTTDV